jgi:NAD(P)-dependent dehydrogenase (short-subunit alcohol dehydrogenase family)
MLLAGRRIIVTGAASGIGAATVRACVENGAAVAALDIEDAGGTHLVATLREFSEDVGYFHCDISERGQVDAVFADAVDLLGGLDALVNVGGSGAAKACRRGHRSGSGLRVRHEFQRHLVHSDLSRFVTGQTVAVDGGMVMMR